MTPRTEVKKARGTDASAWTTEQILAWVAQGMSNGMEFLTLTRNQLKALLEQEDAAEAEA